MVHSIRRLVGASIFEALLGLFQRIYRLGKEGVIMYYTENKTFGSGFASCLSTKSMPRFTIFGCSWCQSVSITHYHHHQECHNDCMAGRGPIINTPPGFFLGVRLVKTSPLTSTHRLATFTLSLPGHLLCSTSYSFQPSLCPQWAIKGAAIVTVPFF